jgi:eukaryotic-like serine/threonine-protein kinase
MNPGDMLGPYRVLEKLGEGGMGEVYRAHDTRLGRDVAIKVLPADLASDPDRLRRFEQEARTVAALSHPNIVALFDIGTHDGAPFLVSELLEGHALSDAIDAAGRDGVSLRQAIDAAVQIARGLAAAHGKGIIHRDLKPANVFLTRDGHVKILDFGIAKLTRPDKDAGETAVTRAASTEMGHVVGTVGYMAPEQVRGLPCDHRADIFAFGCVLYEMLAGQRAFRGATPADTMSAILKEEPPPLVDLRRAVPPALQQIVDRCLEKRPEDRFSSAHDLGLALEAVGTGPQRARPDSASRVAEDVTADTSRPSSPFARLSSSLRARPWRWLLGALVVSAAVAVAVPVVNRQRQLAWVRNQAMPELLRRADARDYWPAFRLARQIEAVMPGDASVANLRPRFAGTLRREIRPKGAAVLARPRVGGDADWIELGTVTGKPIPAPLGYSVFKVQAPGFEPREFGMTVSEFGWDQFMWKGLVMALSRQGEAPEGMVRIDLPAEDVPFGYEAFGFLDLARAGRMGSFFADAREVTNREFKRFVDAGGYQRREYWTEPFERDGTILSWDEAVAQFRDATGRPGPAGWQVGAYEAGTEDLPVTGVSWYEAAAYAAFAGKRLPSVYHFAVASGRFVGGDILSASNFSGKLAPAGKYRGGLNYWSLYDAAGNAREWCANAAGHDRFALGGAADGPPYMFWNTDLALRSPFDRNPTTGFRCIRPVTPDAQDALLARPVAAKPRPDWSKAKGFSDEAWKTWQTLLSYAKAPLDEKLEWTDDSPPNWRMEKATFTAAYPNERVIVYLFLPKNVPPPYQAVIFVQAGYGFVVSSSQDGRNTQDLSYWDYLVKDGRAVVYPIYKGIYERGGGTPPPFEPTMTAWVPQAKDMIRTIDYLETRKDIRVDRLGFLGLSAGADVGTMICAVEKRFRTAVLQGAGLNGIEPMDSEELGFSRRCSIPTQMVNGRFDGSGQDAVFQALGMPLQRKRHIQFDGDHTLGGFEKDFMKVNLEWFDKYLGPVRR